MGWLRPGHLIIIALLAVLVAGGAITNLFGLLGAKVNEPKRLEACLSHHHVDVGTVAGVVGDPTQLLSAVSGHSGQRELKAELRHAKVESGRARAVVRCVERVTR
jgi:hypothetical protein